MATKFLDQTMTALRGGQYSIDKSPILTYHTIDGSGSEISVTSAQFQKQMAYMHDKGYRTIPLSEMVGGLRSGCNCLDKTIVLTFDDGFKNNIEVARPILEKYGFTATIFVTTGFVGRKCGWVKEKPISEIPLMTWEEINEMHCCGFDIQPHSCTHPFLTRLTDSEAWNEIVMSKQEIEKRLNKVCDVFCYPYGDFDDRTIDLVRQAGYAAAVTIKFGRYNSEADLYKLARLGTAHFANSMLRFKAGLAGTYDLYLKVKQWAYHRG